MMAQQSNTHHQPLNSYQILLLFNGPTVRAARGWDRKTTRQKQQQWQDTPWTTRRW